MGTSGDSYYVTGIATWKSGYAVVWFDARLRRGYVVMWVSIRMIVESAVKRFNVRIRNKVI